MLRMSSRSWYLTISHWPKQADHLTIGPHQPGQSSYLVQKANWPSDWEHQQYRGAWNTNLLRLDKGRQLSTTSPKISQNPTWVSASLVIWESILLGCEKCSSRVLPSLGAAPGVIATQCLETNLTASLNARGWPKGTTGTLQLPGMGCMAAQNHKSVTKLMTVQICSNGVFALNSAPYVAQCFEARSGHFKQIRTSQVWHFQMTVPAWTEWAEIVSCYNTISKCTMFSHPRNLIDQNITIGPPAMVFSTTNLWHSFTGAENLRPFHSEAQAPLCSFGFGSQGLRHLRTCCGGGCRNRDT